ncbi:MAG: hypothetical protein GY832_37875, partial [Chloroflexi bacterium]|nr:hypothetical protein [Chloroflexota bacterium]
MHIKSNDADSIQPTDEHARHYNEYLALKRQYPDSTVLLLRGHDYETYGDDAKKVLDVLGTNDHVPGYRAVIPGEQRVPVVSVAVSVLDESLSVLTRAGCRVALAEQVDKVETNAPGSRMAVERLTAFYDEHPHTPPGQKWITKDSYAPESVHCVGCGRLSQRSGMPEIHWRVYAEFVQDAWINIAWACPACWNRAKLPDPSLPTIPAPIPISVPKPPTPRLTPGSTDAVTRLQTFYERHQGIHSQTSHGWRRQLAAHFAAHQWCVGCGQHIHTNDLQRVSE